MRKLFCDRCGVEMDIERLEMWIGSPYGWPKQFCEDCTIAFRKFLADGLPKSRKTAKQIDVPDFSKVLMLIEKANEHAKEILQKVDLERRIKMSDYFNGALAPNKYNSSGEWIQAMIDAGFTSQTRLYYLLDWIGHDAASNKDGWWYAGLAKMFMNFVNHQRVESDERKNEELEKFYLTVLEEIDELRLVDCSDPSRVAQRAVKKVWKEFHEN